MTDTLPIKRPALRYHGGKWRLAPWIISFFPKHETYVEPFGGAGSVLLQKPAAYKEFYNDLDDELVNFFSVLRDTDQSHALISSLTLTPYSRAEFEDSYEPTADPVERARHTVVRAFMAFGTEGVNLEYCTGFRLMSPRTNKTYPGEWSGIPENLKAVAMRLKNVVIEKCDALKLIRSQDSTDTLFYLDPPYLHDTRPNANCRNYRFEMSSVEHGCLARLAKGLKGKVIISGYKSELYDQLYSGWRKERCEAWASGQTGSVKREEILWMNF